MIMLLPRDFLLMTFDGFSLFSFFFFPVRLNRGWAKAGSHARALAQDLYI